MTTTKTEGIITVSLPCGVVEGFYGPPWSHLDRLYMIRFLGENGFNTYMYSPKDDEYHRSEWRKNYPEPLFENLKELISACEWFSVKFVFTISPGLSMKYSDIEERRILFSKLTSVTDTRCAWVGILLDDIPPELLDESDRKKFKTLAGAHSDLLNEAKDVLSKNKQIRITFCPTYYANDYLGKQLPDNDYLFEIGEKMDLDIDIMWTGMHVVSTTITAAEAIEFENAIKRKPFLWDNYPVNDYFRESPERQRLRLNVGPFNGRSADLLEHLSGYVSNPMNESEASKVPLLTLKDYLKNPREYSASASYDTALLKLYGEDPSFQKIKKLFDSSKASPLYPHEAEDLERTIVETVRSYEESEEKWYDSSSRLRTELSSYDTLHDELMASTRNKKLLSEFDPILQKLRVLARLGLDCLELAESMRKGPNNELNDESWHTRHARLIRNIEEAARLARNDSTQALGQIDMGWLVDDRKEKLRARDYTESQIEEAINGEGIPMYQSESPVLELYRWVKKWYET